MCRFFFVCQPPKPVRLFHEVANRRQAHAHPALIPTRRTHPLQPPSSNLKLGLNLSDLLRASFLSAFALMFFYGAIRTTREGLKTGRLPYPDRFHLFPRPDRRKNPTWFWFNFAFIATAAIIVWVLLSWALLRAFAPGLTSRSSRTPPALPSALSQHLAISAPLIASVQAWPLSFIR